MFHKTKLFLYANFFTAVDRYIYAQLFVNYLIGVMFFSSIIMINELYYIIRYYFEQNVPLLHVFSMIGALIPFLVSFSMPFGVLPAYLLFFGKLSQDSEITAMRACGFSQFRIMWPGILFGILIMFFAFHFKNTVESKANAYFLQLKAKVLSQKPVIQLLDNVFLNIGGVQISFQSATRTPSGDDILNVVYAVDVQNKRTIRSKQARIFVNPDNPEHYIIRFLNGDMNQITVPPEAAPITNIEPRKQPFLPANILPQALSASNTVELVGIITNTELDLSNIEPISNIDTPNIQTETEPLTVTNISKPKEEFYISSFGSMIMNNYVFLPGDGYFRGPETMSFNELRASISSNDNNRTSIEAYKKAKRNKTELDRLYFLMRWMPFILVAQASDAEDKAKTTQYINDRLQDIIIERQNANSLYRSAKSQTPNFSYMKLHEKLMLPVAAFMFVLLALPLGMFSARSGRGEGLSISLAVTLVFYGFKSAVENGIGKNTFPPEAIWLPVIIFGLIAVILFSQKVRE